MRARLRHRFLTTAGAVALTTVALGSTGLVTSASAAAPAKTSVTKSVGHVSPNGCRLGCF
ncbi:hypothetical protein AB0I54_42775 [Streptomyces sp. NPDC050625]|uniref:hypothetical protein n=1 Tax=Streptomyces sp. NPDC050625 TaxID=3154629 RepID=UPI00341F097B